MDRLRAFVAELFAGLGPIAIGRMFGGAGVYAQGCMFPLLADDVIYLKADEALKARLGAHGSGPFIWIPDKGPKAGQPHAMGYWRLPDDALDDPEAACAWGRAARAIALAAPPPKRRGANSTDPIS